MVAAAAADSLRAGARGAAALPLAAALVLGGCAAAPEPSLVRPRLVPALPDSGVVLDLSHPLTPGIPVFPGGVSFTGAPLADLDQDGYFARSFAMGEHAGTHVDAPAHFAAGGATAAGIDPGQLVGEAVVIDIRERVAAGDPDQAVTVADLLEHERRHGPLPAGAIVLMLSGWDVWFDRPQLYVNQNESGELRYPGFSAEAVDFLVTERDIRAVGTDTLSIDMGLDAEFRAHRRLLGAGKYAIENLRGLERLPPRGARLVVAPLPIVGGSGAPARVLAILPR